MKELAIVITLIVFGFLVVKLVEEIPSVESRKIRRDMAEMQRQTDAIVRDVSAR